MQDGTLRIRPAQPEDISTIVALSDALFREDAGSRDPTTNLAWATQEGQGYFTNLLAGDTAACWLAESVAEGRVVGYLAGRFSGGDSLRPISVAMLESMYVREKYRGSGAGAKLVEQFLLWAQGQGAQRATVTAYATNEGAIRFYERLGFSSKSLSLEREVS